MGIAWLTALHADGGEIDADDAAGWLASLGRAAEWGCYLVSVVRVLTTATWLS